ncbi:MAG: cytochrome c oxidase subunit 4 [Candidatus Binataceae bacterium]
MAEQQDQKIKKAVKTPIPREQWARPLPEKIPPPTYWPAIMSLGIVFILFGVVTSWIFSAVGFVLFLLSLGKWVGELLNGE